MNEEEYVPGPYDAFRGIVEIDCSEFLPPKMKAKFRIGKFVPVEEMGGDLPPIEPPGEKPSNPSQL
jgi:hypothetical protein